MRVTRVNVFRTKVNVKFVSSGKNSRGERGKARWGEVLERWSAATRDRDVEAPCTHLSLVLVFHFFELAYRLDSRLADVEPFSDLTDCAVASLHGGVQDILKVV